MRWRRPATIALGALLLAALAGTAPPSARASVAAAPQSEASGDSPVEVEKRRGAFFASVAQHREAVEAYLQATRLAPEDAEAWRGLGESRRALGDVAGAVPALRRAAELSGPDAALHGSLGELYLTLRRPVDALGFLESAAALAPDDPHWRNLVERARREAVLAEQRPVPAPEPPARPGGQRLRSIAREGADRLESVLVAARAALPPRERERLRRFGERVTSEPGRRVGLGLAAALTILLVVWRFVRGRGDLAVSLEYPSELRGRFHVRIATRKGRHRRQTRDALLAAGPGASGRWEHADVSRETQFRGLPPRAYYVTVEGLLQDPVSGEVLSDHFEEQRVQVRKGRTRRISCGFLPKAVPVDVKVFWDGEPVDDASVISRELPQVVRFVRNGAARIALPPGRHTLAVGSGDRVAQMPLEIDSFQSASVSVDLAQREALVFKGCPPAVKPYLDGELTQAARALEREGQAETAHLVLADLHASRGEAGPAAEHYEAAGRLLDAAALRAAAGEPARSAALYERAGELRRAAETYLEADEPLAAGQAFEAAGDLDRALDCFRKAGDVARQGGVLERRGDLLEAGRLALRAGDRRRAARLLKRLDPEDADWIEGAELLADIYEDEGHLDLAAGTLAQRIAAGDDDEAPIELHERLAGLFERSEQWREAIEVLEAIRRREPTWPNVATRIEVLRKRVSEGRISGVDADAAPTAFVSESRYELVEEIGRGGMGVVWKARDRRLGRVVAIKRLPENLRDHPKAVQLFLREAQAAAALNHPNIVTVYDADQEGGVFFITMELLEGYPLHTIVRNKGRLSPRDTARLGVQIAAGLDYAHQRRIVHRDIKTANLFFTRDRLVKIMDFGLAKTLEEVRKTSTIIGGTPYYMSPEQAAGGAVDHRTDLYAFGVTLYELATGEVPFPEGDVAYHHRHTQPPDPRTKVAELPAELAELILQMIQKDMEARPDSAAEVGERLQALARAE